MVGTGGSSLSKPSIIFWKPGFTGVNGGFNIHSAAAYYDVPFIVAPLKRDKSVTRQKIYDNAAEYDGYPHPQVGCCSEI
jgi:hypothetical protein